MRSLLLLLAVGLPIFGSTYTCVNNATTDTAGIQAQLNAGGNQTTTGSCIANNLTLGVNGTNWQASSATITASTNGGVILNFTATGAFTMNGFVFEGMLWNANNALTGAVITNNTLENTTGGSFPGGGGFVSNGFHNSTITGNTFNNLFSGGYTSYDPPNSNPGDSAQPACWQDYQGLDATTISNNRFTKCANDGFHINPNGSIHSTNASTFSYNYCAQTHRACYEIQAFVSNFVVKGNVALTYNGKFWNSFGYSMASVGTNFTFINNLGSLNTAGCAAGLPDFLEIFLAPSTIQGNVAQSVSSASLACSGGVANIGGWDFAADNLGNNTTSPSNTNTFQNNVMCGNSTQLVISHEDNTKQRNNVDQYNYKNASSCPGTLATSSVATPVFTSSAGQAFPAGGTGTWTLTQISSMPVKWVTWTVDGAFQSQQELGDVNTNFASDLKWGYHATFNTSAYSNGSHTITATTTDVLGATNTASQTFTVGSTTGPAVQFSPTSVAFGSQTVSVASSPSAITLTNIGSATLTISGITVTGTNSADFGQTNTCGSSLAAAASCTITVTFTPGAMGARTASVSVADNAPSTPQTVALSGTGVVASPCPGSILLNCDFSGGTASWTANVGAFGIWTVDASGPTGVNASHGNVTAVIPSGNNFEVFQQNLSPTNGTVYTLKFLAKTNHTQQWNIRLVDSTVFTDYGLTYQPVIDSTRGWQSYSFNFTVINSPPAGSARFTIQTDSASPGDQNYFTDVSLAPAISTEVTAVIFPYVDHATASVGFQTLTNSNQIRIRYGTFPYDCTTGTGGTVENTIDIGVAASYGAISIGGMAPATTYSACPEPSKDGGVTFLSGFGGVFTTQPLPTVHPSLPIKPIKFDTSYPDTTGYGVYNVLSDCSDFGTAYTTILSNWALSTPIGTVVNIPPGTSCTTVAGTPFAFEGTPPDVHQWDTTDITLPSTITWAGHPLAEGDLVSFGRTYATEVTYPASTTCDVGYSTLAGGGVQSGQRYPIHYIDSSHFQIYCLPATQYDPAIPPPTPPVMVFSNVGSTVSGQHFLLVPWKQFLDTADGLMEWDRVLPNGTRTPKAIIRSAAPDSQLPPPGAQITPAWASKMATFVDPATNATTGANPFNVFMVFGNLDANVEIPIGNYRLGPGIEITTQDYATSVHSSDPAGFSNVLNTYPWDGGIIYDRIYYHMLGAPNRANADMYWNGSNLASIGSWWDIMTYFHANNVGLAPTVNSGSQFTIATGTASAGVATIPMTVPAVCTIAGSGTGTVFVYDNLLSANAFTVAVPSGITATCTGTTAVSAAAGTSTSTCDATNNGWPKTGKGEVTVAQIACITVASGTLGTATAATANFSDWDQEGDNHMIGGIGPGPYVFCNNYSVGVGIPWHWDASGGAAYRGDYTVCRNYLYADPKFLVTSSTSDGLKYYHRQPMEHKGGQRINQIGNIFDTTWREDTPDGTFYALTPLVGAWITDVNFQSNTFMHGSAVMEGINTTCPSDVGTMAPCARPAVRYRFENNLAYDINGVQYTAFPGSPGEGWNFQLYGVGDMIVNHNTYASSRGNLPWLFSFDGPAIEGYQHTGNVEWITGVSGQTPYTVVSEIPLPPPGCAGLGNIALLNCGLTQGIGTTAYNWSGNLVAGGYTNSLTPTGQITTSAMSTLLSGLNNDYIATGTVAGTTAAIGWQNPTIDNAANYCLIPGSSYKAGTNAFNRGADLGVDCNILNSVQGRVELKGVPASGITTTSANIAYIAPDSGVCSVDYSATDPNVITSFTRVADSGGARARSTALTGLTTKTHYNYRLECPGNAIMSQRSGDFWTQ